MVLRGQATSRSPELNWSSNLINVTRPGGTYCTGYMTVSSNFGSTHLAIPANMLGNSGKVLLPEAHPSRG